MNIISKIVCQDPSNDILGKVVPTNNFSSSVRKGLFKLLHSPCMAHMTRIVDSRAAIVPCYIPAFLRDKFCLITSISNAMSETRSNSTFDFVSEL